MPIRNLRRLLLLLVVLLAQLVQAPEPGSASASARSTKPRPWAAECAAATARPQLPSRGKVALVTGAAGFIGSHVAEYCANELGMHVIALDDLSGGFHSNLPQARAGGAGGRITFMQGDVRDAVLLEQLFATQRVDYVYHLAAFAAEGLSHFIRSFIYRNNLVGSAELLNVRLSTDVDLVWTGFCSGLS